MNFGNTKDDLTAYQLELNDSNYYNPELQVVRVKKDGKLFDLQLLDATKHPNPKKNYVLCLTTEKTFLGPGVQDELLLPGVDDEFGTPKKLPVTFCTLVDLSRATKKAAPTSVQVGMSMSKIDMTGDESVVASVSMPQNVDYTKKADVEPENASVGMFINKDGVITLKSSTSSITIGKEGIFLSGKIFKEENGEENGIFSENPLRPIIPPVLPAAALSGFKKLPSYSRLQNICSTAIKFVEVSDKARAAFDLIRAIG